MKKNIMRALAIVLSVFLTVSLVSCSKTKTAMKIGGVKLSEQEFAYLMSCYRPYWINQFGSVDNEEFWSSQADGVTVKDYLQDVTMTAIKSKLTAAYLFDEYKLTLSAEKEKEVKTIVNNLLLGVGGEEALEQDSLMVQLGMKLEDLEKIFLMNAKAEALQDYLYGEEGIDVVTSAERDAYYQNNYYRYLHLYIMDVDFVRDDDGDIVYEEGVAKWEEISDERWDEKFELAKSLQQRAENGEDFEKLMVDYTEEIGYEKYPYGHYVCGVSANENNYFPEILENVKLTEIGGVRLFRSDYGLHLIKRLELDDKGYEHEENEDDFSDFVDLVTEEKYKKRLSDEFDKIKINEDIINKYPIDQVSYSEFWTNVF